MIAKAQMRSAAECDMPIWPTFEIKGKWSLKYAVVAVRGCYPGGDSVTGVNRCAMQVQVTTGTSHEVSHRRRPPKTLLNRRAHRCRTGPSSFAAVLVREGCECSAYCL